MAAAVATAVTRYGPLSAGLVVDARTGRVLYDRNSAVSEPPASTTKLLTAVAALRVLGPATRLVTSVVGPTPDAHGTVAGDLVLVGGGDPTLTRSIGSEHRASLQSLVAQLEASGVRAVTGRVLADTSLFTAETVGPGWSPGYVTGGSVAPVEALELDGGRLTPGGRVKARYGDPALVAVQALTSALRTAGITVAGAPGHGTAPAGAPQLAHVSGLTVAALVTHMLQDSDNDIAECLGRLVAIDAGLPGDAEHAGQAVLAAARRLGVPVSGATLVDSSGLSHDDRLTSRALVFALRLVSSAGHADLRTVFTGLPVAGVSGTLDTRYLSGPALAGKGKVRAKTGAINGVSTLAGTVPTASGRLLAFSFALEGVTARSAAESLLDRTAAALTAVS